MRRLRQQCEHAQAQPQPLRLPHVLTTAERYRAILGNHLPEGAVEWVYAYLDHHHVHFHIVLPRQTKLGDYRWPQPGHPQHEISVNGDLGRSFFLWVLLHEMAHLETHLKHPGAQPHGHEWQHEYRLLLQAQREAFPPEARTLIDRYTARIPLNRRVGRAVEELLHRADAGPDAPAALRLDSLPVGSRFRLCRRPQLLFEAVEKRRTRWMCREVGSGRQYLVAGSAEVRLENQ